LAIVKTQVKEKVKSFFLSGKDLGWGCIGGIKEFSKLLLQNTKNTSIFALP